MLERSCDRSDNSDCSQVGNQTKVRRRGVISRMMCATLKTRSVGRGNKLPLDNSASRAPAPEKSLPLRQFDQNLAEMVSTVFLSGRQL